MKKLSVKLIGANGNIFNLLGIASRKLKKHGFHKEASAMRDEIFDCTKSYGEALQIIIKYVDVE